MCKGNYLVPRDPTQPIEEKSCTNCGKCKQLSFLFDVSGPQSTPHKNRADSTKDSTPTDDTPDQLGR